MIRSLLALFNRSEKRERPAQRQKIFLDTRVSHIYAVGDVHGCHDQLEQLETRIALDCASRPGEKLVVMLGDYVDRGPKSASVLDRLMARPGYDARRICLAGNHEEQMLDFLTAPSATHRWLDFGGRETLQSYGIHKLPTNASSLKNLLLSHIPDEHRDFLVRLPSLVSMPGLCLVHAGTEEGVALADQRDEILLWMRPTAESLEQGTQDYLTVHGHTPVSRVEIGARRINVDTGAYVSGILSAVRLSDNGDIEVLQSG